MDILRIAAADDLFQPLLRFEIRIGVQRELQNVEVSAGTGQEERAVEPIVLGVDIGTGFDQ